MFGGSLNTVSVRRWHQDLHQHVARGTSASENSSERAGQAWGLGWQEGQEPRGACVAGDKDVVGPCGISGLWVSYPGASAGMTGSHLLVLGQWTGREGREEVRTPRQRGHVTRDGAQVDGGEGGTGLLGREN